MNKLNKKTQNELGQIFRSLPINQNTEAVQRCMNWQDRYLKREAFLNMLRKKELTGKQYSDEVVAWDKLNDRSCVS